jgi:hypothetical protein
MKPRTVTTYKILVVAAAAATGATVALSTEAGSAPSPSPNQPPAGSYRPLHDGDGYPLVGNLIRKGGNSTPRDAGSEGGP